jgi:hypothetical protein
MIFKVLPVLYNIVTDEVVGIKLGSVLLCSCDAINTQVGQILVPACYSQYQSFIRRPHWKSPPPLTAEHYLRDP